MRHKQKDEYRRKSRSAVSLNERMEIGMKETCDETERKKNENKKEGRNYKLKKWGGHQQAKK